MQLSIEIKALPSSSIAVKKLEFNSSSFFDIKSL